MQEQMQMQSTDMVLDSLVCHCICGHALLLSTACQHTIGAVLQGYLLPVYGKRLHLAAEQCMPAGDQPDDIDLEKCY